MPTSQPRLVTGPVFRWFAFASFLSMILIVLSGAAVRLTGSGLGCPDWPTCFHNRISGSWSIHPFIEYANRMVTVTLVVASPPSRSSLPCDVNHAVATSWFCRDSLILGVVADAVLGGVRRLQQAQPVARVAAHAVLARHGGDRRRSLPPLQVRLRPRGARRRARSPLPPRGAAAVDPLRGPARRRAR